MAGEDVETRGGEVGRRRRIDDWKFIKMFIERACVCILLVYVCLCMYVCLFMLNQSPCL